MQARPICFMLLTHWARRAASRAAWTAGSNSAIRTAMIAITTSNSISVKPRREIDRMAKLSSIREKIQKNDDVHIQPESRSRRKTGTLEYRVIAVASTLIDDSFE